MEIRSAITSTRLIDYLMYLIPDQTSEIGKTVDDSLKKARNFADNTSPERFQTIFDKFRDHHHDQFCVVVWL